MKKTLAILLTFLLAAGAFTACDTDKGTNGGFDTPNVEDGKGNNDVSEYTLQGIIDSIYAQKAPLFAYGSMEVDLTDEYAYTRNLGIEDPSKIAQAMISEPMMGSQAYSLVLVKAAPGQDVKKLAEEMKANINPRKWVCVEADDIKVTTYGDIVCFCMISTDFAQYLTADEVITAFTNVMTGKAEYKEGAEPNIPEYEEEEYNDDEFYTDEDGNIVYEYPDDIDVSGPTASGDDVADDLDDGFAVVLG